MTEHVDLYDSTYGHFHERVLADIRAEAYGLDIGQNSWITADEYDTFYSWLELSPAAHVLEVACGAGGPALHLARKHGCRLTGIDINEQGVLAGQEAAKHGALNDIHFRVADAQAKLPFEADTFDAVVCIDSVNHFRDRQSLLLEWHRVLTKARGAGSVYRPRCDHRSCDECRAGRAQQHWPIRVCSTRSNRDIYQGGRLQPSPSRGCH